MSEFFPSDWYYINRWIFTNDYANMLLDHYSRQKPFTYVEPIYKINIDGRDQYRRIVFRPATEGKKLNEWLKDFKFSESAKKEFQQMPIALSDF